MSIGLLAVVVALGIALVVAVVHYTGGSKQKDVRDPGAAIVEFGLAYPGEAIRAVMMTADGMTSFFRLASGNTGYMQAMGHHFIARLIVPGSVDVRPLEEEPGFRLHFQESAIADSDYLFANAADAAEVLLWIMGNYAGMDRESPGGKGGPDA